MLRKKRDPLLAVKVHRASEHGSKPGFEFIEQPRWHSGRMETIYADGGYG